MHLKNPHLPPPQNHSKPSFSDPVQFQKRLAFVEKSLKTAETLRTEENWVLKLSQKLFGQKPNGREEFDGAKFLVGKAKTYFQQGNISRANHWLTKAQHLLMRSYGNQAAHLQQSIDRGQKVAQFGKATGDMFFKIGIVGATGAWAGPAVAEWLTGARLLGALKVWGISSIGGAGALGLSSVCKRTIEAQVGGIKNLKDHVLVPEKMNHDLVEGAFFSSLQVGLPLASALGIKSAEGMMGAKSVFHQLKYASFYQASHSAAETAALGGSPKQIGVAAAIGAALPFGYRGLEGTFSYPGKTYARFRVGRTLAPWTGQSLSEEFTAKIEQAQERFGLKPEEFLNLKLLKSRHKAWVRRNHVDNPENTTSLKELQEGNALWTWLFKQAESNPLYLHDFFLSLPRRNPDSRSQPEPSEPLQLPWEGKRETSTIQVIDRIGRIKTPIPPAKDTGPKPTWKISPKVPAQALDQAKMILFSQKHPNPDVPPSQLGALIIFSSGSVLKPPHVDRSKVPSLELSGGNGFGIRIRSDFPKPQNYTQWRIKGKFLTALNWEKLNFEPGDSEDVSPIITDPQYLTDEFVEGLFSDIIPPFNILIHLNLLPSHYPAAFKEWGTMRKSYFYQNFVGSIKRDGFRFFKRTLTKFEETVPEMDEASQLAVARVLDHLKRFIPTYPELEDPITPVANALIFSKSPMVRSFMFNRFLELRVAYHHHYFYRFGVYNPMGIKNELTRSIVNNWERFAGNFSISEIFESMNYHAFLGWTNKPRPMDFAAEFPDFILRNNMGPQNALTPGPTDAATEDPNLKLFSDRVYQWAKMGWDSLEPIKKLSTMMLIPQMRELHFQEAPAILAELLKTPFATNSQGIIPMVLAYSNEMNLDLWKNLIKRIIEQPIPVENVLSNQPTVRSDKGFENRLEILKVVAQNSELYLILRESLEGLLATLPKEFIQDRITREEFMILRSPLSYYLKRGTLPDHP